MGNRIVTTPSMPKMIYFPEKLSVNPHNVTIPNSTNKEINTINFLVSVATGLFWVMARISP
jgi:hypothetical protein